MAGPPLSSCTPQQWSLSSLAGPGFFLDFLSCGALAPSGCLHAANPSPFLGVRPLKPEPQHPSPTRPSRQASVSGWGLLVGTDPLCGILSTLLSTPLLLHSPLRLQSSHLPIPASEGGFLVCRKFSSFTAPPHRCWSCPNSFVFFSFFLLPYPIMWRFSCLFGSLRSSASIQ